MIRSNVLERATALHEAFDGAKPFRHVVIDNFLDDTVAEAMLHEFPVVADRSTLLNEFGQHNPKKAVTNVREIGGIYKDADGYIQGAEFIAFMERVTGIPNLRYDPHYYGAGTHENFHGAGLDAHYDFNIHPITNQHRRLNAIIYLNKDWNPDWKGSICFHSDPWDLDGDEVVEVQPEFNRCVIFETTERSWHSVPIIDQPPELRDKSRKSFTIYMYTDARPAEETAPAHGTVYVQAPLPAWFKAGHTLSGADVETVNANIRRRHEYLRQMYRREYKFAEIIDQQKAVIASHASRLRAPVAGWGMCVSLAKPGHADNWIGGELAGEIKAVRDLTRARLFAWRPSEWGAAEVKLQVGMAQASIATEGGRIEIDLPLSLQSGETAAFCVSAPCHDAPNDARELSLVVERIEFD